MKADSQFLRQPRSFWANVRTISQAIGYTDRKTRQIKVPTLNDIQAVYDALGLTTQHLVQPDAANQTALGAMLLRYFSFRAERLNNYVEPRLMDKERAQAAFEEAYAKYAPRTPVPLNKQKGEKKDRAFFTGLINTLIEANANGLPFDPDPRTLTTVTRDRVPLRTLSRRVDGAFPSPVNPVAVWEIKEYYYTTTFGSRVADGVYETLLDGIELEELAEHERINVLHYLMVDSHYTWWESGRSYLCRLVDMLHMGLVDEVLFGYEVVERLPQIVAHWVALAQAQPGTIASAESLALDRLPTASDDEEV